MRKAKLWLLFIVGLSLFLAAASAAPQKKGAPARLAAYRGNNCVVCHEKLTEPLHTSAHFYEWLGSAHEKKGVGCEKCHGGDSAATNPQAAHRGMLRAAFPQSRLHPQNLPATCGACHQDVVTAFTRSTHYLRLQASGAGPSCTTCHQHMATAVITWPPATAALCASCHNETGGSAAQYPDVSPQASNVIAAFSRADEVIDWAGFLINEDRRRAPRYQAEQAELQQLAATMKAAKLSWHEFNLKKSRAEADRAFNAATKIKNSIK